MLLLKKSVFCWLVRYKTKLIRWPHENSTLIECQRRLSNSTELIRFNYQYYSICYMRCLGRTSWKIIDIQSSKNINHSMASKLFSQSQKLRTRRVNKLGENVSYTVVNKKNVSIADLTGSKVRLIHNSSFSFQ